MYCAGLLFPFIPFLISLKHVASLTVCSCHVTYAFQSESILYSCLNVKELLARSRREIWRWSDCNWTRCCILIMVHFLVPNICPKWIFVLSIKYYNFFSLFTSIYLLIKLTLIISKNPILLKLTYPSLVSVHLSSLQFVFFAISPPLLLVFCKLSWWFFFIFLHSNNAFTLPRSLLNSLTWLSSLLFHQGCFFSPFVLFFSNNLVQCSS